MSDLFKKPIPAEIGQILCDIERNNSGFNKFWPKYTLKMGDSTVELLTSKKLANSKTSHYKIDLANIENRYKKIDEESYIGRLRGTFTNHEYHLFDTGLKNE